MWFGGGQPPPAGVVLGGSVGPPSLFKVPARKEVFVK